MNQREYKVTQKEALEKMNSFVYFSVTYVYTYILHRVYFVLKANADI